jgi:ADP-heptose:LPS heptosyltransferase
LSQLAALIARAAICVTNDSGPMHLAVALNRPVVCIFGSTDQIWAGPYLQDGAVVRTDLPCSPCYLRQLSRCAHGHACMQLVSSGAVIERMEATLHETNKTIGNIERPLQHATESHLASLRGD